MASLLTALAAMGLCSSLSPAWGAGWETLGPTSRRTPLVISEIMYKPAPRADGRNLEFLEVYNSNPFFEDLSGCRLAGGVDFTFPPGIVLAGNSFLLVARAPADVQAAYPLARVLGPYAGSLKSSGTIRLRDQRDSVLLEVSYDNKPPWPVAADGAGHSLVLARPSYGEGDWRAWAASGQVGGSPTQTKTAPHGPLPGVMINEILINPGPGQTGFVELYNHATQTVDLAGCVLTDLATSNRFVLPSPTPAPAGGFVAFDFADLGFSLNPLGGRLYLKSPDGGRVLDALAYEPQSAGVALGRFPDAAEELCPLSAPSPGRANSGLRTPEVLINELMYHPISEDDDDQFVELYNPGTDRMNVGGWRLTQAVGFTFPADTFIAPDGYLVVARNLTNLLAKYPNLNAANAVGNFAGKLPHGGGRLGLDRPEQVTLTGGGGSAAVNVRVALDDVRYSGSGRSSKWAAGGGSSLELMDPRGDRRRAANWADSDESSKSGWTAVEAAGVLDNGGDGFSADSLQLFLLGEGECLVDNVEVLGATGANRLSNGTFDAQGVTSWFFQGTQEFSGLEDTGGIGNTPCLHLRASERGDTGANRIRSRLTTNLSVGSTARLRAQVRWLKGCPEILLRLRGNYLEAPGRMAVPPNLGTPGARNSRAVANAGPAIHEVTHTPPVPAAGQAVRVTCRAQDPDGLAKLTLRYRLDPATNLVELPLVDDGTRGDQVAGDGVYSALLPGQPAGTLVAFQIEATDGFLPAATSRFPDDAPARQGLVRFGDPQVANAFGNYRLWMTQATLNRWSRREKLSNTLLDVTFVYGDQRVVYNAGAAYSGSPWHSPGYTSPTGGWCNYKLELPADDRCLGTASFNKLHWPGNSADDDTAQREETSYWIARRLGLPYNYQRYVNLFVNGLRRASIFEDTQVPGAESLREWFPADNNGDLYKITMWFEFNDAAADFGGATAATLQNFLTTGGRKKLARYRWNWEKRAAQGSGNDYADIFALVDAANLPVASPAYRSQVEDLVDIEQWMRLFAVEHIVGNWDSYGNRNGQNMYAYKPLHGRWQMLAWDLNIDLGSGGGSSDGPTSDLFQCGDAVITKMYNYPAFRRAYWRACQDAVSGPLLATNVNALLDARYAAFRASGVTTVAPTSVKSWIASRRNYLVQKLNALATAFAVTTLGGDDFVTNQSTVTLTGTAPIAVRGLRVNGADHPVDWTSVTNWALRLPLSPGVNALALEAVDGRGNRLTNAATAINITYQGPAPGLADQVVLNEWMANNTRTVLDPLTGRAEDWLELYNPTAQPVDLGGWLLTDGAGSAAPFVLPPGTVLAPGRFLVIWADGVPAGTATGEDLHANFKLNRDGDRLHLYDAAGRLVDSVAFGPQPADTSEGRCPDGGTGLLCQMVAPTPGTPNNNSTFNVVPPRLQRISLSGPSSVTLAWQAEPGRAYHIQYKNQLADAAWHNLAGDVRATDTSAAKVDTSLGANPRRFYRVQVFR